MQRREKLLLFGLLAMLVLFWGVPRVQRMLFGPLEAREIQLRTLSATVSDKEDQELAILRATARMKDWKAASLPPDDLDAQRLYQQWLTDLAQLAGLSELKVTPGRRAAQDETYVSVQVGVEGTGTLDQVANFLYQFHRAALLHRVVQLNTESSSQQGSPRLKVTLMAEGLCLREAPARERLFPEAELKADVDPAATQMTVGDAAAFPAQPGFRIRIGHEYAVVTRIDGHRWTVARGVEATTAADHSAGARIELAPVNPTHSKRTLDDYRMLVAHNPFGKPRPPRTPRLAPIAEQTVVRGTPWKLAVGVSDWDLARGTPVYELGQPTPGGMRIDPQSGEITWSPAESVAAGEYTATVAVRGTDETKATLSQSFQVILREPNQAPTLAEIAPQTLWLSRPLSLGVEAGDDGPADQLTYKLGDDAPEGAAIDARTGELVWTPPAALEPGDHTLTVTVTDAGSPPMSTSQTIPVAVKEDAAAFTRLVASVAQDERPEAWLYDRSNNRRMIVTPGSSFQIADIAATVREIGSDFLLLESAGGTWRLELGEDLRAMRRTDAVPTVPVSETSDTPDEAAVSSRQSPAR